MTIIAFPTAVPMQSSEIVSDPVDWDELEELILDGSLSTKHEVKVFIENAFDTVGEPYTKARHTAILDGLFPEVRELYSALPIGNPPPPVNSKLSEAQVIEIRSRHHKGESMRRLALAYGVSRTTVSDIIKYVTWTNVA